MLRTEIINHRGHTVKHGETQLKQCCSAAVLLRCTVKHSQGQCLRIGTALRCLRLPNGTAILALLQLCFGCVQHSYVSQAEKKLYFKKSLSAARQVSVLCYPLCTLWCDFLGKVGKRCLE